MCLGKWKRFSVLVAVGLLALFLSFKRESAAQTLPRPVITGTILLREGEKVTLNRGSQDGVRKGDKFQVSHYVNGKMMPSGTIVVTRVSGTNAEARVTEQSGSVSPEDVVTLELPVPKPSSPAPTPGETTRKTTKDTSKTEKEPVQTPPAVRTPARTPTKATAQTPKEPVQMSPAEPVREATATLPLLPQFSDGKAGGAGFAFDFTNDNAKPFDTAIYRESAHLIFDGQEYRMLPLAHNGIALLESGKTRKFSFALTDFTVSKDSDAWPLKSGRHTALIKFGGKQFGPLVFDWRGEGAAQ